MLRHECGWQSTLSTVFILLKICADISGWMKTSAVTHGHDENLHVDNFMVRNPCLDLMSFTKDRLQLIEVQVWSSLSRMQDWQINSHITQPLSNLCILTFANLCGQG